MKTLSDFNFKNKRVLLRTDLNSEVVKGRVLNSERIKESAITINELKKKKAKVIVIAHQGRPGKSDFLSLKQHSKFLNRYTKIKFVNDSIGDKVEKAIQSLKSGDALLLENVRMIKDEFYPEKKDNKLMKLVKLADIYVNDAFSVCHRKQTSVISFPKHLKSCAGRLLEKEVKTLEKIKLRSCLYILGGAKPEENMMLLGKNKVLACGLFGQLCLIVKGKNLGAQNKYLRKEKVLTEKIKNKLKGKLKKVETPLDFAVRINGRRKEIPLSGFPSKYEIFDIGEKTIKKYIQEIRKAKSIYMKGPAGFSSDKKFSKGTLAILRAISRNKGFSVIGGGHLADTLEKYKISKKSFSHVSLSGGALLEYIAGKKLPGIEALK